MRAKNMRDINSAIVIKLLCVLCFAVFALATAVSFVSSQ